MGTSGSHSVLTRSFTASDGTPLRADYYSGTGPDRPRASRGVVVLIHGYCEHRGRYRHVAEHLNRHGYQVLVGDLRGHGGSAGERGFVRRFTDYLEDTQAFLDCAASALPSAGAKPILIGHSMGGLVGLQFALAYPAALRALALSSPFLGLKLAVPGWKRGLGLVASLAKPTLRMPSGLKSADLSHNPEVCRSYDTDPLVTHEATARWFTEIVAAQADLRMRAGRIHVPTLMLVAGDDRIVDSAVSQMIFDRLGASDKNLTVYPGLFHELFNEVESDKQRVLSDLTSWLAERCRP